MLGIYDEERFADRFADISGIQNARPSKRGKKPARRIRASIRAPAAGWWACREHCTRSISLGRRDREPNSELTRNIFLAAIRTACRTPIRAARNRPGVRCSTIQASAARSQNEHGQGPESRAGKALRTRPSWPGAPRKSSRTDRVRRGAASNTGSFAETRRVTDRTLGAGQRPPSR